ncbi:MAG: hypothetical protein NTV05_05145 [Acidobacteria bacterium]|nr:hypothetical protein [Acidobacteriota bacterium]
MTIRATLRTLTFADAIADRHLFGALSHYRDVSPWHRWIVWSKAQDGATLTPEEVEIFTRHTGRAAYIPPAGGWAQAVVITGRQSGKTQTAGTLGAIAAVTRAKPGEYVILLAQDQRAALRTLFRAACEPFDKIPLFRARVRARRADSLELDNGVILAAYPCRPASVRGLRAALVVLDEAAFYRNSDNLPIDREMLTAVKPCLATTGGKLIVLSSPYGQSGVLYEMHRRAFGTDDPHSLVWQASAPEMNPTLPADYLARMEQDDPDAYRSEVLGEFRQGLSTLLDPDAIAACVADGVFERPFEPSVRYQAGGDAASGTGKDAFTVGIAGKVDDKSVLFALRAWKPPFNPSGVIAEISDLLKSYGLREITMDRYAAGFPIEQFRSHGVTVKPSTRDRSVIYLDFLPLVNAGRVVLLDQPDLLRELRGLERRRGPSGRDRVDHFGAGSHDDRANSAALALTLIGVHAPTGMQQFDPLSGRIINGLYGDIEYRDGRPVPPAGPVTFYDQPTKPGVRVPTVRVVRGDGYVTINATDFDESRHTLWTGDDASQPPAASAVIVKLVR